MEKRHYGIESVKLSLKGKWLTHLLKGEYSLHGLKGKSGLLFSTIILEQFIEEEAKHDNYALTSTLNRSIRSLSSGEQKKALLNYLIVQKPDFLVLDNPYEALDSNNVVELKNLLIDLSKNLPLVQLFNRSEDLLPVITHMIRLQKDRISEIIPIANYEFQQNTFSFSGEIPKPITAFKYIPEVLVAMQNVIVEYDNRCILKDINWEIRKNEFWQLIGPNGSGKTTLLSMIYGDNTKAYGQEIYLFDKKKGTGESVWDIKKRIGYFSPAMLELFKRNHTVEQMIISGLVDSIGLYQLPTTLQIQKAAEWIKLLKLEHEKNTPFLQLPAVLQRLVLIARAMIKHPPLLILDEPLLSLDDEETALVVALINKIAKEGGTSILFVSHRTVAGIQPQFTFKLSVTDQGSVGTKHNYRKI